jgi:hypothetical protein
MVCGFFGVVISLERAVAIGRLWAYAAPLLAGAGTGAALHGMAAATPGLVLAGSVVLLAASLDVLRRQPERFMAVIAVGAGCWTVGAALWAAGPAGACTGRLVAGLPGADHRRRAAGAVALHAALATGQRLFVAVVAATAGAAGMAPGLGPAPVRRALLALALWLLRQDIARRTVKEKGLTRFIAVCLLSGYCWLAAGRRVMLVFRDWRRAARPTTRRCTPCCWASSSRWSSATRRSSSRPCCAWRCPTIPLFYAPLALLHASLLLRVAGDAAGHFDWTRWGALLSALALLAFIASTAAAVLGGRRRGGSDVAHR